MNIKEAMKLATPVLFKEFRHNKYHIVMKSTGSPKEMDAVAALLAHWYYHGPELLEALKRHVEAQHAEGLAYDEIVGGELIAKCEEVEDYEI